MAGLEIVILTGAESLSLQDFEFFMTIVSSKRRERVNSFRTRADAANCLLGEALARIQLCRLTGLNNADITIDEDERGKPYLAAYPPMHFNFSHTEGYAAFAADNEPVGIDIERVKPFNERIAERFFTTDEYGYIMSAAGDTRVLRFYEVWTKKESFLKREGVGLTVPINNFSVLDGVQGSDAVYHEVYNDGRAFCTVCADNRDSPSVSVVTLDGLRNDAYSYIQ